MNEYIDYTLNNGAEGMFNKYTDKNATVIAIKNLILSRPGNFPLHPSFGMDIGKYQFEMADDITLSNIKTELSTEISKFIPSLSDVNVEVKLIENDDVLNDIGVKQICLGISITANSNSENLVTNFLIINEKGTARVINETY